MIVTTLTIVLQLSCLLLKKQMGDVRQMVLEGLDDVDWSGLHHAYGPATDVPDMLRGLLSDDRDVRMHAWEGLGSAVHHQGDVYDSTVSVVPFLLQILLFRSPRFAVL